MRTFLEQEKLRCAKMDKNFTSAATHCQPDFDGSMCWEPIAAGTIVQLECPFEFCNSCTVEERFVERTCLSNVSWATPDYDRCLQIYMHNESCIEKLCHPCPDSFRETFRVVTLWLSVISAVLMVASLIVFSTFKSLQCRRLTIHKHLVTAFIIRFFIFIIWIVLQRDQVFHGCTGLQISKTEWFCKLILAVIMYSTLSNVFWMFLEGCYLVTRFTVLAMRSEGPFIFYAAAGWGVPLVFIIAWVLALELQPVVPRCWLPYTGNKTIWLLIGPMSLALGLNFLFMLIVLAILVQKLWASNTVESKKIWKTIKATVLLVPLLGTTNLLLFYEPNPSDTHAYHAYMLSSAILQHSQGIFVALFYCFGNAEVQTTLKRQFDRLRHYQPLFTKQRSVGGYNSNQVIKSRRTGSEDTNESKI